MPVAMKRPCETPGCGKLAEGRLCVECRRREGAVSERKNATQRGYGYRWQKQSRAYLDDHPECSDPRGRHQDRVVAATEVHHVQPHRGDPALFWDPLNWMGLCKQCHSYETYLERMRGANGAHVVDKAGVVKISVDDVV